MAQAYIVAALRATRERAAGRAGGGKLMATLVHALHTLG